MHDFFVLIALLKQELLRRIYAMPTLLRMEECGPDSIKRIRVMKFHFAKCDFMNFIALHFFFLVLRRSRLFSAASFGFGVAEIVDICY